MHKLENSRISGDFTKNAGFLAFLIKLDDLTTLGLTS